MLLSRAGLIFLLCCLIGLTHAQTVHNAEWLLRQDPKAFTLQLVTLSNADQASRMAQQHNLPEALAFSYPRTKSAVICPHLWGI